MHLKKSILSISAFLIWNSSLIAMPSVDILQSCKNTEPANKSIMMKLLDDAGPAENTDENCNNQYISLIDGHFYGWGVCNKKPYLIIAGKKYNTETAQNYSMNPAIKPTIPIISHPLWYRIDKGSKSYLCLLSPLSDTGSAANAWQYYIIDDAFDANKKEHDIYYYFFDQAAYKRF